MLRKTPLALIPFDLFPSEDIHLSPVLTDSVGVLCAPENTSSMCNLIGFAFVHVFIFWQGR